MRSPVVFKPFARFAREKSGTVYIFAAAGIVALLGFVGLSVDVGHWYTEKRSMQAAADGAAMAAALEIARGATVADAQARGEEIANANGYSDGSYVTVDINIPPVNGPNAGNNRYAEALVTQQSIGFLSAVLRSGRQDIATRAVATTRMVDSCVYSLNPTANAAISVGGTTDVDLDCGMLANSSASDAINQTGSSCLDATNLGSVGGQNVSGCDGNVPPQETGLNHWDDPMAYLNPPTLGICDFDSLVSQSTDYTFDPSDPDQDDDGDGILYFCGGLEIESSADVTFEPGLYAIGGIGLHIAGSATVTGSEVTFYFPPEVEGDGSSPSVFVDIAGGSNVTLAEGAPGYPEYDGVLFYQDPNAFYTPLEARLEGGSGMELTGILYFPEAHVRFAGNSGSGSAWTVLIPDTVEFTGNSQIKMGALTGDATLALAQPSLTE